MCCMYVANICLLLPELQLLSNNKDDVDDVDEEDEDEEVTKHTHSIIRMN